MTKRTMYFDLLTIAACFAVVCLHCNTLAHAFQPTPSWNGALTVEVLAYWAVPVFFMLTGANNLGYRKKYDTKEFLTRRLKKLLIPFVVWTLLVYLLHHVVLTETIDASLGGYITAFMDNTIEPIYWFFFAIISLTLAMPVLSLLADNRKILWYMTGVAFLLSGAAPTLFGAFHIPWTGAFNLPVAGGYVMYALLGYLVATGEVPKKYRIAIYLGALACFALRYIYTYVSSYELGFTDRFLFDYLGFYAVIPALAVFLLFKHKNWDSPFFSKHAKAITTISGLSFGVYLIHKIILDEIIVGQFGLEYDRILMRIICPIALYLVSLLIIYILKKIPVLRNIVP